MVNKGDFIGFTIGDYHSSDLGIIRTSEGSRYNDSLTPTLTERVVPIPGRDGSYFFESNYTQKVFSISFAFDSLTEKQIRKLKQVFSIKVPQKLIFDESPYKYYIAKIISEPSLKTICFEENGQRVYKGEGRLQLVAYYPYARSRYKFLDEYTIESIPEWKMPENIKSDINYYINKDEWQPAILLPETKKDLDTFTPEKLNPGIYSTNLYNAGDIPTDFIVTLFFDNSGRIGSGDIEIYLKGEKNTHNLKFSQIIKKGTDDIITINTKNELVEGFIYNKDLKKYVKSGNIYNDYKIAGNFYKIPLEGSQISISHMDYIAADQKALIPQIKYDYLYY